MGEFAAMPVERAGEIIRLNVTALTELSQLALENFREQERPAKNPVIINVASVVGFIPFPLNAVYGASKAYVVSFSEALRSECREEIRQRGWGAEVYTPLSRLHPDGFLRLGWEGDYPGRKSFRQKSPRTPGK